MDPLCFAGSSVRTLTVPYGKREAYIAAGWTEDIFRGGIVEAYLASDNYLFFSDAEACKDCSMVLPIDMHNSETITALQFYLSLPVGVTLSDCLLTERKGDHTVTYSLLANGNYQVLVFSINNQNFLGSEGALLELSLEVGGDVPSGDYPMIVNNIELTTSDEQAINPDDVRATLTVTDVKPADANGDGKISITAVVNKILKGGASAKERGAAAWLDPQ